MKSSGFVLFVCAGLMLSGGSILGGSAAWSLVRMSYFFWTTDFGIEIGSSVIMMAGSLLCLPTCWLATIVPYHPKSSALTGMLMMLAAASMLTLTLGVSSMAGLQRSVREPQSLNSSMQRALTLVGFDPAVRSSFCAMQIDLKCCGILSYADWFQYRRTLPPACCGRAWNGKRTDQCNEPIYTMGCLGPALTELRNFANSLSILACALILVLALALFMTAYTLVSEVLPKLEERVKPQPLRIACLPQGAINPMLSSIVSANR